jgi:hypothetical protein
VKPATSVLLLSVGTFLFCSTTVMRAVPVQQPASTIDLERALGKWYSTERFENEPRITVALRSKGSSLEGWAVLLGQHRKTDDRATLGLSFSDATWAGQRFVFSTVLPEDEGTIGWELQVASPTTAVLRALTEDGRPIQDELKWDMTKREP